MKGGKQVQLTDAQKAELLALTRAGSSCREAALFVGVHHTSAWKHGEPKVKAQRDWKVIGGSPKRYYLLTASGYWRCENRKLGRTYMHRDVWEAAHGPIPAGMEINHIDHDRSNNDFANLELVTKSWHGAESNSWKARSTA